MAETDENEGMSTGKKVAAGAALGVAVPAAVAVGKKLLGGDEEGGDSRGQAQSSSGGRRSPQRTRATSKRARSTGSRSGSRSRSAATKRPASSSSSRRRSTSSGRRSGSTRTKEQLYNQAKRLKIEGRSSMTKAQLERAVSRASR